MHCAVREGVVDLIIIGIVSPTTIGRSGSYSIYGSVLTYDVLFRRCVMNVTLFRGRGQNNSKISARYT